MISSVENKKSDLAIANITITSDREKKMDFSQPIFDSGLQLITSKKNSKVSI
jgi:polar amino acid transport system substrate-binding protein